MQGFIDSAIFILDCILVSFHIFLFSNIVDISARYLKILISISGGIYLALDVGQHSILSKQISAIDFIRHILEVAGEPVSYYHISLCLEAYQVVYDAAV